jgi:hypothetical protein
MNKRILYAGLPIAALFCGGANAQSVYTDPDILGLTPSQQTTVYRTIVRENVAPRSIVRQNLTRAPIVAQTERPVARKQVRYSKSRSGNVVRTTTTERIVTRPVAEPTFVTADSLDLTPNQRTIVYRTLVQQPVQAPVVTGQYSTSPYDLTSPYARPYVTTDPVVTAPSYGYAPSTTGVGVVTDAPGGYVPSSGIVLGTRIPPSVPLYAMPAETIAAAPSMAAYRYALIGGRVYLVDPRDGIVAAMLYQ